MDGELKIERPKRGFGRGKKLEKELRKMEGRDGKRRGGKGREGRERRIEGKRGLERRKRESQGVGREKRKERGKEGE